MEEVLELIHFIARYTSKVAGESCPGTFFFFSLLTAKRVWMTPQLERDERVPALLFALPRNSRSMLLTGCMCVHECALFHTSSNH